MNHEPYEHIQELAKSILKDGIDEFTEGNYVFFGHSLGALVAYEVARLIEAEGRKAPMALFLSAFPAPPLDDRYKKRSITSDDLFELVGSFSPELLEDLKTDSDLQELFLSVLRADYEMLKNYQWQPGPALTSPLIVMGASDEDVSVTSLKKWATFTQSRFHLELYSGGHFYFLRQPEQFFAFLNSQINNVSSSFAEPSAINTFCFEYIKNIDDETTKLGLSLLDRGEKEKFHSFKPWPTAFTKASFSVQTSRKAFCPAFFTKLISSEEKCVLAISSASSTVRIFSRSTPIS